MEGAACCGGGGRETEEGPACSGMKLPGFRFHPTDEELVSFYLHKRVLQQQGEKGRARLALQCLIPDLDIYKYDPWDLPQLAKLGESQSGCYFFSPRDRKYRNSTRPNRVTLSGFWKATGTDRHVYSGRLPSDCIGLKKSLVFYLGRASKGTKTDWMMHEFRLPNQPDYNEKDTSWALCKIFKRKSSNSQGMSGTRAFVAEDVHGTTETNIEAEDCSEEESKSENTVHPSVDPGHVASSFDVCTPSSCTSQVDGTPSELKTNVALFSRQREPLTVRISKSCNGWQDDLDSWLSPAMRKSLDNITTGGEPCVGDLSLLFNDQALQEPSHGFMPDYLGHLVFSPWNTTLPLWEQPTHLQDSMTFNASS